MEVNSHLTDKAQRDYELVKQAVENGSQRAYSELMLHYKDSVYFMLLKMTNSSEDADDLTIEAFGKAFKKLSQYTPDYAFSTWLFKIATNNCIDFLRKKKNEVYSIDKPLYNNNSETTMAHNIPSETLDPEENYIKKQKIKLMRDIVEKLKPRYRKLIELRYFNEFSYEEIAEEMKLPIGTVKAQLFRAREFLFNILKDAHEKI